MTGTFALTGALAGTVTVFAFAVHLLLQNLTFYVKEPEQLVRFEHRRKFIDIFQPNIQGCLLVFDALFLPSGRFFSRCRGCSRPFRLAKARSHFIVVTLVERNELCFLLVGKTQLINKFPNLGFKIAFIHGRIRFLSESRKGRQGNKNGNK